MLDITVIEPHLKHLALFEKLDALKPGSSFTVHNDRDPQPLLEQILAERGPIFVWKPLASGPLLWQVKVTRSADGGKETVGEIVLKDYRKAKIFKGLGIDFSCGGNTTIAEACKDNGLSAEELIRLLAAEQPPSVMAEMDFKNWDIGFLCKYLVQLHHQYIKTKAPFIEELARKVSNNSGDKHPEIIQIAEIFEKGRKILMMNMQKEEQELFPYITEMNEAKKKGRVIPQSKFKPVFIHAELMRAEHEKVVEDFQLIRRLTNNYQLPPYVMYGYGILFKMLQEYEDDLYLHLHLENNILFPKAIKIENEMRLAN